MKEQQTDRTSTINRRELTKKLSGNTIEGAALIMAVAGIFKFGQNLLEEKNLSSEPESVRSTTDPLGLIGTGLFGKGAADIIKGTTTKQTRRDIILGSAGVVSSILGRSLS